MTERTIIMSLANTIHDWAEKNNHLEIENSCVDILNQLIELKKLETFK